MNIPSFTAQASVYRSQGTYRVAALSSSTSARVDAIVPAFIPSETSQDACRGCTDRCDNLRNICMGKVAIEAAEACLFSFGTGCAGAAAWALIETGGCYAHYAECFGVCQIPDNPVWKSKCCPKVCGIPTPGVSGSGCCDHGETCKGLGAHENTRDGCCPVGRDCGEVCCAADEKCCGEICCPTDYYCLDGRTCSQFPGTFQDIPAPPRPESNCYFFEGGSPCGNKCCYGGQQCCGVDSTGGPICKDSCLR